jgi:acetyl esterase/lipase
MYRYDPELGPYVAQLPSVDLTDPVRARDDMERIRAGLGPAPRLRDVGWVDHAVPATATGRSVGVRVYQPTCRAGNPTAAIVFLHGGGYVMGSVESEHLAAGVLAVALGVVVASVEYRLAPEHPYPAALEDAYAALQWLRAECAQFAIDPARIAVAGNSAGGGLAAALAIHARDQDGPAICFQYLGIPQLDDRLTSASSRDCVDTPLWNRASAEASWRHYLGPHHGSGDIPLTAAPGRARPDQLTGLPPAYVSAMAYDPLRDEDVAYAGALAQAGVPVELHLFPGTFHGSAQIAGAQVSKRGRQEMHACLRRALSLPARPVT